MAICPIANTSFKVRTRLWSICVRYRNPPANSFRQLIHVILILCSGIGEFIDTALAKGAAVGLLAGTCSIPEEQIMTAALFALGEERTQQLHTFTCNPQQSSRGKDDMLQASDESLTLEQSMAAARARVLPLASTVTSSRVVLCWSLVWDHFGGHVLLLQPVTAHACMLSC